mmetsp:Transcript_30455/g.53503  ORF Transcript_30455/g.53503 Transcript_30455/m.53503 type:complete len:112 (-) Transcript_30455:202-537(-)|eukprot:CAMPEP_0197522830 /NCGR_PEP_ID=MMETSP1318-20131121/7893_1 /TAXON_ID=552666 /ORGANISM="Partenskyella glossopodia, Strain RCC365" /LENGTH=111 /DNA_ID=CAMNT_0043075325 /DNA_START=131 /DNA_END=466 /DNA_ORIENTATION=+
MYSNIQKGKLSFKSGGKKKKKKKRKKERREESQVAAVEKKQKRENVDKEDEEDPLEGMTQSEKNFLKAKMLQEEKMIKKKIKKTHREKIKAFNEYLGSLTEHNDIPRVGPG